MGAFQGWFEEVEKLFADSSAGTGDPGGPSRSLGCQVTKVTLQAAWKADLKRYSSSETQAWIGFKRLVFNYLNLLRGSGGTVVGRWIWSFGLGKGCALR